MSAQSSLSVIALQLPAIGNRIYGDLLRQQFEKSAVEYRAFWANDDRSLAPRIINQILRLRVKNDWILHRDADFWHTRADFGNSWLAKRIAIRELANKPANVLHFHTQAMALCSVDIMSRIPTVITSDQTMRQSASGSLAPGWKWNAPNRHTEKKVFQQAKAVVMFSQWAANDVIDTIDGNSKNVHVLPVGIEVHQFSSIGLERSANPNKIPRLLFIGGDFQRKGGELLLQTFINDLSKYDVELDIVSNGAPQIDHPKIHIHRDVQAFSQQWYGLYNNADIFVLPTRHDAFGIAYLEAMAAGLPVIGSNICAGPEIITPENGILITPESQNELNLAIRKILDSATLRQQMSTANRERARSVYDIKIHVEKLGNIFQAVSG